jgi:alkanesulfonate monooxygenase SsuD/methylene tetrahydromethanopterin reductase-like flavin-dependent oxidoreductase (luciferase family)
VRRGLFLPIFDQLASPARLAAIAERAEAAGWDGVFVWDHVVYRAPITSATDPWVALAAMATATSRVRLGPMVTPLARRRPWIVARQLVALDDLSGGRMVFGAGLGLDRSGGELSRFGEELDARRRASMLEEGLAVLRGLLSGQEVSFAGEHYRVDGVRFLPGPVQPSLPVWLGARFGNARPIRRAAGHDGLFVVDCHRPEQLAEVRRMLGPVGDGFDLVFTAPAEAIDLPAWEAAGATWWLAWLDPFDATFDQAMALASGCPPAPA